MNIYDEIDKRLRVNLQELWTVYVDTSSDVPDAEFKAIYGRLSDAVANYDGVQRAEMVKAELENLGRVKARLQPVVEAVLINRLGRVINDLSNVIMLAINAGEFGPP